MNQKNIIKRSLSGIGTKEKNNNKNNNNTILSIRKKRHTLNNNEIKPKNLVNNINFKNKKENIYKHRHTLNNKDKIKLEITNKENKNNFQNIFLRLKSEGNINSKKDNKCKTPNKYTKKTNIPKDIKEIEEQFNNFKNTVELMNKESEKIDKNNNFVNQNELKLKEIIGNLENGDQLEKQLFKECINNTKEKILYNIIIMNNEKIKKVKEMKNEIEKIYVNISDFIVNSKNENFIINKNGNNISDIKNNLVNLKDKSQKYIKLSREIQNSQKMIYNNLIYEISYFKNSIAYLKNQEKNQLIKQSSSKISYNNTENNNLNNNKDNSNNAPTNINNVSIDNKNKEIQSNNQEYLENYNKIREKLLMNLNKESLKLIVLSAPKKDESELSDLINYLKDKTTNLNIVEKAYIVFYWMAENIIYDMKGLKEGKNFDSTPEGIYKYGKSVCFGYSKLFAHIANNLGVDTEYINGYAKGNEYHSGEIIESPNHEWNAVKIDNNYFIIDSTWGSGHEDGDDHIKELDDFYFFCNPKYLIYSHFPENEKWQLLNPPITKEEFFNRVQIHSSFYFFHFTDINFKNSHFNVNNLETLKLSYDLKNSDDIIELSVDIYSLNNNGYEKEDNCDYIIKNENNFEIKLIFNKMGIYKVCLFGKNQDMDSYETMLEYYPTCIKDAENKLRFPKLFSSASDIQIIQPLYDNLKVGEEVKFILKSNNLNEIMIKGDRWHCVKKNKDGYFEETVKIGAKCGIGKKNEKGQCVYLVKYNV